MVKLRILHFVPDIGIANGVMSVILNYFKVMPEDIKFDVMYFCETEKNRTNDIEALGGRVFKINYPGLKSFIHSDVDEFFKEHKGEYDAVHIHAPYMACLIGTKAKLYGIKKVAVHCHSTWFSLTEGKNLRNKLLNIPTRFIADKQFACGREAGLFWYKREKNFTVLPNAVECDKFRFNEQTRIEKRKEFGFADDTFVVGHVGRSFSPQKNHVYLIKIFAQIKKQKPNSVLLLAGAEEEPELKQLAKELNVYNSILFLSCRDDVPELLSAMDIFIFPSLYEGLPVSVVEAQTSGLQVIMSNQVTDQVCVTDNVTILPVDIDPKIWADKAIEVSEYPRKDNSEIMKKNGWDIKSNATRLVDFYKGE